MNEYFYTLLLGHLLGDFVFQSDGIAENKVKYWNWNLLHTVIVCTCMYILVIPLGGVAALFILLNGISHFFIDQLKSKFFFRNPVFETLYFITDQIIHIFLLYLISHAASVNEAKLFFHDETLGFFIAVLVVSGFVGVLNQYVLKCLFSTGNKFFLNHEKVVGNIMRVVIFLAFSLSFQYSTVWLWGIPVSILLEVLYYRYIWYRWLNFKYFCTRLLLDVTVPVVGSLLVMAAGRLG